MYKNGSKFLIKYEGEMEMLKNLIKEAMLKERISIKQLSEELGLTYANTHALVNRKDLLDTKLGTLTDVAKILKIKVTDLYEDTSIEKKEEDIKMKYTKEELINNVCEKSFRNSQKNHEKLKNCGLEQGKKYDLGNNIWISFSAYHGGIDKSFWWGERKISKETAIRKAGIEQ